MQSVKFGEVCAFVRGPFGGSLKKENFQRDGFAIFEQQHAIYNQFEKIRYFVDQKKYQEMKRFRLFPGDIIMSCSGTMGKVAIVPDEVREGIINQALLKLTPNRELSVNYLKYWMESEDFKRQIEMHSHGAAIKNVASVKVLKEIPLPLPPLEEQHRIAAILDKADAIRRKRQQALTLADDFLRATFLDMFGDPVVNPKGWDVKPLGEILDGKKGIVDGPFGSAINTKVDYIENGDIPVIRTKNVGRFEFKSNDLKWIRREKFEEIKRSAVYPGDIVLTKVGTIGNVCRFPSTYPEAVLSTTGSCRIKVRNDLATDDYLLFYLDLYKPQMLRIASTAVQPFLNLTQIKGFEVPLPPLDLQQKFSSLFVGSERHSKMLSAAERQAVSMSNAISQLAFTGGL